MKAGPVYVRMAWRLNAGVRRCEPKVRRYAKTPMRPQPNGASGRETFLIRNGSANPAMKAGIAPRKYAPVAKPRAKRRRLAMLVSIDSEIPTPPIARTSAKATAATGGASSVTYRPLVSASRVRLRTLMGSEA